LVSRNSTGRFFFDEFFRIKGEGVKRTEGTGLGLHISKKIVSEMGGSIEVESQAGLGSTFRVRLPAWRVPAENTKNGELGMTMEEKRILIVDDDTDFAEAVGCFLEANRFTVF